MSLTRYLAEVFTVLIIFIVSCATQPISYEKGTTVAVWDLEDLTPGGSLHPDLGEPLSAKVIETLKEIGDHTVVERERLVLALEELNLGTTSLVDESTRLRIGRLVQAQMMIFGGYQVIADHMRLDLRLVEVETGKILRAAQQTTSSADLSGWLKAAQKATAELVE